jgi:hypothetical protein
VVLLERTSNAGKIQEGGMLKLHDYIVFEQVVRVFEVVGEAIRNGGSLEPRMNITPTASTTATTNNTTNNNNTIQPSATTETRHVEEEEEKEKKSFDAFFKAVGSTVWSEVAKSLIDCELSEGVPDHVGELGLYLERVCEVSDGLEGVLLRCGKFFFFFFLYGLDFVFWQVCLLH